VCTINLLRRAKWRKSPQPPANCYSSPTNSGRKAESARKTADPSKVPPPNSDLIISDGKEIRLTYEKYLS